MFRWLLAPLIETVAQNDAGCPAENGTTDHCPESEKDCQIEPPGTTNGRGTAEEYEDRSSDAKKTSNDRSCDAVTSLHGYTFLTSCSL
jgi:hypothetical protein